MRPICFTLALCALLSSTLELANGTPTERTIPPALQEPGLLTVTYDKYPPIKSDEPKVRSPCPFLNSAANHGFLPYDGKNIKLDWLRKLLLRAGLTEEAAEPFITATVPIIAEIKKHDPTHGDDYINLDDVNLHGFIEHHVSLTRPDILEPDTASKEELAKAAVPEPALVDGLVEQAKALGGSADGDAAEVTYAVVGAWRKKRVAQEEARKQPDGSPHKPEYFTSSAVSLGSGECALLLEVLGNGRISGKDFKTFFAKENFPDGWKARVFDQPKFTATTARCADESALEPATLRSFVQKRWPAPAQNTTAQRQVSDPSSVLRSWARAWKWALTSGKKKATPHAQ